MGAGTIIPPFTSEDDEGYAFIWSHNPDPIPQGEQQVFYIEGGVPPYTWSLASGALFSIPTAVTSEQYNFIEADASAETDDEDTVTVEDAEGNIVTGLCRCCLPHPCCPVSGNDNLLLHADDQAEGSTTFTDSGGGVNCPHTVTVAVGTPTITLTQQKFGVGSIKAVGSGRLDVGVPVADFDFPTGTNFIIDFWVRLASLQNYAVCLSRASNNVYWVGIHQGNPGIYSVYHGSIIFTGSVIAINTWNHIYFTRVGGLLYGFVNGVKKINGVAWNYNLVSTQALRLLHDGSGNSPLNGFIDEFRLVKGEAGYTANFAVPTAAYPSGGITYPGYTQIAWAAANPTTIENESIERYAVTGGCPPYHWEVTGNDAIYWTKEWTARGFNTLVCENVTSLDGVVATVTDGCGKVATSGTITITFPPTGEECCPRAMAWDSGNPQTILRNGSAIVSVVGGCPNYLVSVSGTGFWLDAGYTTKNVVDADGSVAVYADGTACGTCVVSFIDSCGSGASGTLREPNFGHWALQGDACVIPGEGYVDAGWFNRMVGGYWQREKYFSASGSGFSNCAASSPCGSALPSCPDVIECVSCLTGYDDCSVFAVYGFCVEDVGSNLCTCRDYFNCCGAGCNCWVCHCVSDRELYLWVC